MVTVGVLIDVLLLLTVGLAAVWDVRARRIPNGLVLAGVAGALLLHGAQGTTALAASAAGAGIALVLGFTFFAVGMLGAGDAKLLCAAAALLGLRALPALLGFAALAGGLLALASAARQRIVLSALKDSGQLTAHLLTLGWVPAPSRPAPGTRVTLPSGVAIAVGALAARYL